MTPNAWPTSDEGDTHTRLQTLVDESFGYVPTTPIPGLLAILEEKLPAVVLKAGQRDSDAEYVVQKLLFAMHIYSGYKVESRGPSGCIFDSIRCLSPATHEKLVAGVDPGDMLDDDDDDASPAPTPAARSSCPALPVLDDAARDIVDMIAGEWNGAASEQVAYNDEVGRVRDRLTLLFTRKAGEP